MIRYVEGISDTDNVKYCPHCGNEIDTFNENGIACCENCGKRFAVIIYPDKSKNDIDLCLAI